MSDPQSHGTTNPIIFFDITLGGKSYLAITTIFPLPVVLQSTGLPVTLMTFGYHMHTEHLPCTVYGFSVCTIGRFIRSMIVIIGFPGYCRAERIIHLCNR